MSRQFAVFVLLLLLVALERNKQIGALGYSLPTFPTEQCGGLPLAIGCNNDCVQEHGALEGNCNFNNVCVCPHPGDNLAPLPTDNRPPPPLISIDHLPFQFCEIDDRNSTGIIFAIYKLFCDLDCQCVHGALGGDCDFERNICDCHNPPGATYISMKANKCPYYSLIDRVSALNSLQGKLNRAIADIRNTN